MSYQSIPYALLQEYLGGLGDNPLADLIKDCGWSLQAEGGVVSIRNQETTIRPKKILAKIEFESESCGWGLCTGGGGHARTCIVSGCGLVLWRCGLRGL